MFHLKKISKNKQLAPDCKTKNSVYVTPPKSSDWSAELQVVFTHMAEERQVLKQIKNVSRKTSRGGSEG